jgi:ribosomal protein S18 acetylase RimI-like enzyme
VDFNVLIKRQRRGIGTALMDEAERRIAARSAVAGIGVGLTADYGAAQVLYCKRGYVPDGCGAIQRGQAIRYGEQILVDDDLVIYLTRRV